MGDGCIELARSILSFQEIMALRRLRHRLWQFRGQDKAAQACIALSKTLHILAHLFLAMTLGDGYDRCLFLQGLRLELRQSGS